MQKAHLDRVARAKAKVEEATVAPISATNPLEETIEKPKEAVVETKTTGSEDVRRS